MFEQIITERDVRQLIHKHELVKEKIKTNIKDYDQVINLIYNNISSPVFALSINTTYLYDKPLYIAADIESKIVLRYLDKLIKRVYKVKQSNRDRIIKQVISILYSTNPFYITKLDISSFYETINTTSLIQRLKDDGIISFQNISYIEDIIVNKTCGNGLPRGVAFSSSLSELYLRDFDKFLKADKRVSYFARYVDDIIIISSDEIFNDINLYVTDKLKLNLNPKKIKQIKIDNCSNHIYNFDFLGYSFKINNQLISKKRKITISIAKSKIDKIKRRIIKSSTIFIKDGKFDDYYNRLRLLLSNYRLDSNRNGILMSGIFFNYKYITDYSSLNKINQFKNFILVSNTRISKQIQSKLKANENQKLLKLNVFEGFHSKMTIKLSKQKITKLFQELKYV